jgi:hypothetical protein
VRKVRCVSPHGGAHHGVRADNGMPARPGFKGTLSHPPNEGGWVDNAFLGRVAVGSTADAPEAPRFIADGFHFVDDATGAGDVCKLSGDLCWCGRHRAESDPEPPGVPSPAPAAARPVTASPAPAKTPSDPSSEGE